MAVGMHKPVSILVCGNAGVVGGDLLRRRDILTYWALNADEAAAVVSRVRPKVALVREEHALSLLAVASRWRTPVVVLLEGDGWARRDEYFLAGATALVQASAGARILEAVAELANVTFAKQARVLYETTVEVQIAGQSRLLETVNLSASGVCIAGIEALEQGLGARITFPLLDPPLTVEGLVVRTHNDGLRDLAGIAFVNPASAVEDRLRAIVAAEIARDERADLTVQVPVHADPIMEALDHVGLGGADAVDALKAKLRDLHLESKRDNEMHKKARPRPASATGRDIDHALSPGERALVLGEPSPEWAPLALDTRLKLHVERKQNGAPSARTVQDALTLCRTLGEGAGTEAAMVEASAVRASLLRDVYAEAPRSRHGAQEPAPSPQARAPKQRSKSVRV